MHEICRSARHRSPRLEVWSITAAASNQHRRPSHPVLTTRLLSTFQSSESLQHMHPRSRESSCLTVDCTTPRGPFLSEGGYCLLRLIKKVPPPTNTE